jgi:hypothetical protein
LCAARSRPARAAFAVKDLPAGALVEIEAVELVAGKDQYIIKILLLNMAQTLPHRIGRSLKPVGIVCGLFCSNDVHERGTECTEMIGILDVLIQRCRVELR